MNKPAPGNLSAYQYPRPNETVKTVFISLQQTHGKLERRNSVNFRVFASGLHAGHRNSRQDRQPGYWIAGVFTPVRESILPHKHERAVGTAILDHS